MFDLSHSCFCLMTNNFFCLKKKILDNSFTFYNFRWEMLWLKILSILLCVCLKTTAFRFQAVWGRSLIAASKRCQSWDYWCCFAVNLLKFHIYQTCFSTQRNPQLAGPFFGFGWTRFVISRHLHVVCCSLVEGFLNRFCLKNTSEWLCYCETVQNDWTWLSWMFLSWYTSQFE